MKINRRDFLKWTAAASGTCLVGKTGEAGASSKAELNPDRLGMLTDTTKCIGCRSCEWACKKSNELPNQPFDSFRDASVFEAHRRPDAASYTVVNRHEDSKGADGNSFVKVQCMHCDHPGCVSACLVGAFTKEENGAVIYDAWKCMGCRYCMVACPFQVPAYEYFNALTPQVRKCTLCYHRITKDGGQPACAQICPQEAILFGKRSELLEVAHKRIAAAPDLYEDHVYGEHEVGGTCWLYLTSAPATELGLLELGTESVPHVNETIQHAIFKHFIPPLTLYGVLGAAMWVFKPDEDDDGHDSAKKGGHR